MSNQDLYRWRVYRKLWSRETINLAASSLWMDHRLTHHPPRQRWGSSSINDSLPETPAHKQLRECSEGGKN